MHNIHIITSFIAPSHAQLRHFSANRPESRGTAPVVGSDLVMLLLGSVCLCVLVTLTYIHPIPERSVSPPPPAPAKSWSAGNEDNRWWIVKWNMSKVCPKKWHLLQQCLIRVSWGSCLGFVRRHSVPGVKAEGFFSLAVLVAKCERLIEREKNHSGSFPLLLFVSSLWKQNLVDLMWN